MGQVGNGETKVKRRQLFSLANFRFPRVNKNNNNNNETATLSLALYAILNFTSFLRSKTGKTKAKLL